MVVTRVLMIDPKTPDLNLLDEAARCVHQGGLVVFPTETVYGIAADAANPVAMARLRDVKRRSDTKPFSLMVARKERLASFTDCGAPALWRLVDRFWPGPLTVIVPTQDDRTVGVRVPDHPVALALVERSHCTVAAPSANFEGNPAPVTCQEALRDLDGLVDMAIDSGRVNIGTASTIVDFSGKEPVVVRTGALTQDEVEAVTKKKHVLFVCTGNSCRSVMAEYLFRQMLGARQDVTVSSAGTGVVFPSPASQEAIDVLARAGLDARGHVARLVTPAMIRQADLVMVMTRAHRRQVLELMPSAAKKVYLLGEFRSTPVHREEEMDIVDPVGQSLGRYVSCADEIKGCLKKVLELV